MNSHVGSGARVDIHGTSSAMEKGFIEGQKQRGDDTHSR
jgi:hypothetical protein